MFALFFSTNNTTENESQYGYTEFLAEIDSIERVEVKPNAEIPTGEITVWTDGVETKSFYLPNVNLIYEDTKTYDIPVYSYDVPRACLLHI
jgi:hypothetical protein